MVGRLNAEGEFAEIAVSHLNEQLLVFGARAIQDGEVDHDAELENRVVARALFENFRQLALELKQSKPSLSLGPQ